MRVIADLPDFFLMGVDPLHHRVGIQLPEQQLSFFRAQNHILVAGQDTHTQHISLIKALFGLNLEIVALLVHKEVYRPDLDGVKGVCGKTLVIGSDDHSSDTLSVALHLAKGLLKAEFLSFFLLFLVASCVFLGGDGILGDRVAMECNKHIKLVVAIFPQNSESTSLGTRFKGHNQATREV